MLPKLSILFSDSADEEKFFGIKKDSLHLKLPLLLLFLVRESCIRKLCVASAITFQMKSVPPRPPCDRRS